MKSFNSIRGYFQFALAREFVYQDSLSQFHYRQNKLEKVGAFLARPIFQPGDYLLKNIRSPLFITATVVAGIALTTLVFYPGVVPGLLGLANAIKLGVYAVTQSTIVGVCLRTLGRLNHRELMEAWAHQRITSVTLGSIVVQKNKGSQ